MGTGRLNKETKWSVRYKKWLCTAQTCRATQGNGKTYPCGNCEGYRNPPRERKKPGRKPNTEPSIYAFKGRWMPNGRGIMIPIFDEGIDRENAN